MNKEKSGIEKKVTKGPPPAKSLKEMNIDPELIGVVGRVKRTNYRVSILPHRLIHIYFIRGKEKHLAATIFPDELDFRGNKVIFYPPYTDIEIAKKYFSELIELYGGIENTSLGGKITED